MRTGFVDLQVNGYGGVSFSSLALTADDVRKVADALAARGTEAFCPTVVTASAAVYEHVLPILGAAARSADLAGRILGIHLEGPFISSEEGAVGAHSKAHVLPPSIDSLDRLMDLAGGAVRLLTVAPEKPGAAELIAHARCAGITVSIGHTLAGADDIQRAIDAGATLSTHLGNGCPNFMHRHDNPIWPQLAAEGLTAMLITDGHHLPPTFIRAVLAAKGPGRVIVTSDASPVAGLPPGTYEMLGTRLVLEPNGRVRNLVAPTLAGSSATMHECMAYLESLGVLNEAGQRQVARENPLEVLGRFSHQIS
jgi:N-acetylglucosamine-6-phosphate deacetylase